MTTNNMKKQNGFNLFHIHFDAQFENGEFPKFRESEWSHKVQNRFNPNDSTLEIPLHGVTNPLNNCIQNGYTQIPL